MGSLAQTTLFAPPRVAILGPILLEDRSGKLASVASPLARNLIASLALNGGRASASQLVDDVWGASPPTNERAALHTLVSRTRSMCAADLVVSTNSGYAFPTGSDIIDLGQAVTALNHARTLLSTKNATDAEQHTSAALGLWRGTPGDDLTESAISDELTRQARETRTALLHVRSLARRQLGDGAAALADLDTLLADNPFNESLQLERMRTLADLGRVNEALLHFAELKENLATRLGTQPDSELIAYNTELLRHEPAVGGEQRRTRIGLRAATTTLIGRSDDVEALEELITRSRLVTILGPGGLGKTRLAHEIGNRSPAPQVIVVELASVRSGEDIELAFASTLGIREVRTARPHAPDLDIDVRSRILRALSENETLLIVDNCEHIIDAVAPYMSDILAATSRVRILTTSRSPLAISAEQVYPLSTLIASHDGPAVRLFRERARAARPGVVLPEATVTRLCERLDGLPLAIELAAARTRSLSVDEVERRLSDRFALLNGGDRSAPKRHRTLRAVIEWSWNLLGPSEQSLLRRLSAFPGGFSAEAAETVAREGTVSVFDDLDALVAQSLVSVIEDPETPTLRYRMLETVREFGEQQREASSDDVDIDERINRWAVRFTQATQTTLFGPKQIPTLHAVSAEQDNLISVLRRARDQKHPEVVAPVFAALGAYWTLRGAHSEVITFGETVIDVLEGWQPETDADRNALAVCYLLIGSTFLISAPRTAFRARSRLRKVRAHAPLADKPLDRLARLLLSLGKPQQSVRILGEGQRSSDPLEATFGNLLMTQMHEEAGRFDAAQDTAAQAYRCAQEAHDVWSAASAAQALAQLYSQQGVTHTALEWAYRARDGFLRIHSAGDLRQVDWLIAMNLISAGELERGRTLLEQASHSPDDFMEIGDANFSGIAQAGLAEIALAEGHLSESLRRYESAIAPASNTHDSAHRATNPWVTLLHAANLAARLQIHHLDSSLAAPESTAESARLLRIQILVHTRLNPIRFDAPVLGTGLLAYALWMLDPDTGGDRGTVWVDMGLELVALAIAVHSRQDLASLHHDRAVDLAESWWGAERFATAQTTAASMDREQAIARSVELLRSAR